MGCRKDPADCKLVFKRAKEIAQLLQRIVREDSMAGLWMVEPEIGELATLFEET